MSYTVHVHDSEGQPVGRPLEIAQGGYKAALVAATLADKRTGGQCIVRGPSGAFVTSTKPENRQEGTCDEPGLG